MTLENLSPNEWIANTGAFAHMTSNTGMLKNLHRYFDTDALIIGKSSTHVIRHVDDTYINNDTTKIKLQDVLLVPTLAKNILSIRQLINYYPYNCKFYGVGFFIKE